jgi:hypothetical protein
LHKWLIFLCLDFIRRLAAAAAVKKSDNGERLLWRSKPPLRPVGAPVRLKKIPKGSYPRMRPGGPDGRAVVQEFQV